MLSTLYSCIVYVLLFGVGSSLPISGLDKRDDFEFRIYSNNVRYAATNRFPDEQPWENRKDGVIAAIKSVDTAYPMLIGLQECLHNQLEDVLAGLNKGTPDLPYKHFGVGRNNGETKGEYSPIIYDKNTWKFVNGTTKWLSYTPSTPSKYPGTKSNRIVTISTFKHIHSGKTINYLNTHYDPKSSDARKFSSDEILNYIKAMPNDFPSFLSGDFNSVNTDISYTTLASSLKDTDAVAYTKYNDTLATYTGFEQDSVENTIDFIWAPHDANEAGSKVRVISHEVINNEYNGIRFSDHRPVNAHMKFWN